MATLQLIQALQAGLVNPTTGVALASGKCRFYDIGTLTPQTVYSDGAGASPITQPLTLTAGGVGTVYTASPCRCIVKSADDLTTIYDITAVNGSAPATMFVTSSSFNGGAQTTLQAILDNVDNSFGGTDWKYKIGTTERNIKDIIAAIALTPQDYGALGDGATDDTAAFAALATAQASSGRPVFIPKGTYMLSAVTTFTLAGAIVRGAGRSTILRGTNAAMNMLSFTGLGPRVDSLLIDHSATTTGTAIAFSSFGAIRDIVITPGDYTTALSCVSASQAYDCDVQGITNATTGPWLLNNAVIAGTVSATTIYAAFAPLFTTATVDVGAGGNTTPAPTSLIGLVYHLRVRSTGANCTINATAVPTAVKVLVIDCFNNSGGASTFTLNAQYHGTGNPAPANGTRRVVAFVWDPTASAWFEFARSAADVT